MTTNAGTDGSGGLLVVVGATGNQGRPVLQYFAKQASPWKFQLRGLTRNVQSKASKDLQALGIEMVQADLEDLTSLKQAFTGATHIFANTDSNQTIFNAIEHPEILKAGQTPRSLAYDAEIRMGKNIVEATASTGTLQRLVWSSLPGPLKWSKGKYTKVTMFDAKENIADMLHAKKELQGKVSMLLVGFYANNALNMPQFYAPKKQRDGVYELALPMSGDFKLPQADVDADAGKWVSALFEAPPGTTLVGSSEMMSWEEWLQLWGSRNGVETRYRVASDEEFLSKMEQVMDAFLEEVNFMMEFGFTGGMPGANFPEDIRRMGISLDSAKISDHIQRNDWSSVM